MPRYTPLTAVDEKIRDLAERKKVKEPVCSMYLPSDYAANKAPAAGSAKGPKPAGKSPSTTAKPTR